MAGKIIDEDVLKLAISNIMQTLSDYIYIEEEYDDDSINSLFDVKDAQELSYYESLIQDSNISSNRIWSSSKVKEEIAKSIIESNSYSDGLLANISSIELKYVTSLPTTGNSNTIYILKSTDTNPDTLNLYNDGAWISIGQFTISLDQYVKTEDMNNALATKANDSEVLKLDKVLTTTTGATNDNVLSATTTIEELNKKANDDEVLKNTDIIDNLTSIDADKPLSANQGSVIKTELDKKANTTDMNTELAKKINTADIIDNLASTDINKPLSANQGKILKAEADKKINKTDIIDNLTSTNTNKPLSANQGKILNDKKLDKADVGKITALNANDVDIKDFILENCTEKFKEYHIVVAPTCTDLPANNYFYMNVRRIGNNTFKITAKESNRTNEYVRNYRSDTAEWTKWGKVCITESDIPKTNIAPADETTFIDFKGNSMCNYCVKNGTCYVSLWMVKVATSGRHVTGVLLPTPMSGFFGGAILIGAGDAIPHAYAYVAPDTGELKLNVTDANILLYGSFSYPVA